MDDSAWKATWVWFRRALEQPEDVRLEWLSAQSLDPELEQRIARLIEADAREQTPLDHETAATPGPALEPGDRIGAWRVVSALGAGGTGEVYLVERADGAFERFCALKLLAPELSGNIIMRRFRREQRMLAALSHVYIAGLLDAGTTRSGRPWFLMEWVDGFPITEYSDREGLDLDQRLSIFVKVCDAVGYAHRKLIVHRDLKPGNILVDHDGQPRLLDFGIAHLLGQRNGDHETGRPLPLTASHASPEQLAGIDSGVSIDVYALSILLYEVVCRQLPFPVESHDRDELLALRKRGPEPVARVDPGLPRELDWILDHGLAFDPDQRYRDVAELARDVQALRDDRVPGVAPRSRWYAAAKFARRNRTWVAATAAISAMVLVLAAGLVRETDRARAAEAASRTAQQRAEAVSGFLASLFEISDRTRNAGTELSATEILERGRRQLANLGSLSPERRTDLLLVLSQVYFNLGRHEEVRQLASQAVELARATRLEAAEVRGLLQLALGHQISAAHERALAVLERASELARRLKPPDPELRFRLNIAEGVSHQSLGDHAAAGKRFRASRTIAVADGRPEWLAESELRMGSWQWLRGDLGQAEQSYARALQARLQQSPRDLAAVATARDAHASAMYARGRLEAAEREFAEAARLRMQVLGDNHPDTAGTLSHHGAVLYELQRDDEAALVLEQALAIYDRVFPDGSPAMTGALNNMGLVLRRLDQPKRADALFGQALAINRRAFGEEHRNVATNLNNLGLVAEDRGEWDQALAYYRKAADTLERIHGPGHAARGFALTNCARVLMTTGRLDRAGRLLDEAVRIRAEQLGPEHPDTLTSRLWSGALACLQGRPGSGLAMLEQVRDGRLDHFEASDPPVAEAESLIAACSGSGRQSESREAKAADPSPALARILARINNQ